MRFRITVRGLGIELRGFMDQLTDEDSPTLTDLADAMKPFGLVIASPMEGAPNEGQPTPEGSMTFVADMVNVHGESVSESFMATIAYTHYMQAMVIRGERDEKEELQRQMHERELHHFEVEQENARLEADNARLERALSEAQREIQTIRTESAGV